MADLSVQLERAVPGMMEIFRGMSGFEIPDLHEIEALPEPEDDAPVARTLGLAVAKQMATTARQSVSLSLSFQRLISEMYNPSTPIERRKLLLRAFSVQPSRLHEGHVVPGRLLLSVNDQVKGTIALCALVSAFVQRRRPEPWLSKALVDVWSHGSVECDWFIGALTESPEGHSEMSGVFKAADDADAAFVRQFENDVRAGRTGIPLED